MLTPLLGTCTRRHHQSICRRRRLLSSMLLPVPASQTRRPRGSSSSRRRGPRRGGGHRTTALLRDQMARALLPAVLAGSCSPFRPPAASFVVIAAFVAPQWLSDCADCSLAHLAVAGVWLPQRWKAVARVHKGVLSECATIFNTSTSLSGRCNIAALASRLRLLVCYRPLAAPSTNLV